MKYYNILIQFIIYIFILIFVNFIYYTLIMYVVRHNFSVTYYFVHVTWVILMLPN